MGNIDPVMPASRVEKTGSCLAGTRWKTSRLVNVTKNLWKDDCGLLISFILPSRLLSRPGSHLILSWRRPLSYRNQSIDLLSKLLTWITCSYQIWKVGTNRLLDKSSFFLLLHVTDTCKSKLSWRFSWLFCLKSTRKATYESRWTK